MVATDVLLLFIFTSQMVTLSLLMFSIIDYIDKKAPGNHFCWGMTHKKFNPQFSRISKCVRSGAQRHMFHFKNHWNLLLFDSHSIKVIPLSLWDIKSCFQICYFRFEFFCNLCVNHKWILSLFCGLYIFTFAAAGIHASCMSILRTMCLVNMPFVEEAGETKVRMGIAFISILVSR